VPLKAQSTEHRAQGSGHRAPITEYLFYSEAKIPVIGTYPKGLSPKGLLKVLSTPLFLGTAPPLGGGSGGMTVIMISDIELSRTILVNSGFLYNFFDNIFFSIDFNCKEIFSFLQKYLF
jgi:hypothetical protein